MDDKIRSDNQDNKGWKVKKIIIVACLIAAPFVASASITVNAPSQNDGWAIMFNPENGAVYSQAQFTSGQAIIDTSTVPFGSKWAVDVTYDSASKWQSSVYWYNSGATAYGRSVSSWDGFNRTVNAVTGEITSRGYNYAVPGDRSISVTYSGNTAGSVTLEGLNNDANALDALLKVYRPVLGADNPYNANHKVLKWDPATLSLDYTYNRTAYDAKFDLITISKLDGTFTAQYIGEDLGSGFNLLFTAFDDPGETAYWSTYNHDGSANGVVNNGDGSVTFTAYSSSTEALAEMVPYYVIMDYSQSYADGNDPSEYLVRGQDGGSSLVNPDYYVIPEPAVISLIGLAGVGFLVGRRFIRA